MVALWKAQSQRLYGVAPLTIIINIKTQKEEIRNIQDMMVF